MANSSGSNDQVPARLLQSRRADWHLFLKGVVLNCVGVFAVLFFLLLVFRIL